MRGLIFVRCLCHFKELFLKPELLQIVKFFRQSNLILIWMGKDLTPWCDPEISIFYSLALNKRGVVKSFKTNLQVMVTWIPFNILKNKMYNNTSLDSHHTLKLGVSIILAFRIRETIVHAQKVYFYSCVWN